MRLIKNKNKVKKINVKVLFNLLASLALLFTLPVPVFAAANNQSKEEVVYGMLNNDGSTQEAYVVNIFDQNGEIVDYGDYTDVKNMTSDAEIKMNKNKITAKNTEDKLYYEGILKNNELPWDISIRYFLDNKEYSAEDVGGKSGDLEIKIKIKENKNINPFFYDNYGIQTTVVLDTEKVEEIKAEEATVANVGKNKQLTYTILPGKGADISIKAKVKDFAMEAISINGINLNLAIDLDDEDLMEKVEELLSGVNQLDNGANDLKSGASKLKDGSSQLDTGTEELQNGTIDLDGGVRSLKGGIDEINFALERLDSQSSDLTEGSAEFKAALIEVQSRLSDLSVEADKINELSNASSQIKTGLNELTNHLNLLNEQVGYDQYKSTVKEKGLDIDELKEGNQKAFNLVSSIIKKLTEVSNILKDKSDVPGLESLGQEIEKLTDHLSDIAILFKGNNAAINANEIYLDELSSSIGQIYEGSSALNNSYNEFDDAIGELVESLDQMIQKLPELTGAIDTLVEKYSEFDAGVNSYTEGVGQIVLGYQEIVDGASSLEQGTSSLQSGSLKLHNNMSELLTGTSDLYLGTEDLAAGTKEFTDRTANLDQEVQNEIDETLLELTGDASETISFASDKNKNIKSVQFVMKTKEIKFEEKVNDSVVEESKELTFLEKLKDLFTFN